MTRDEVRERFRQAERILVVLPMALGDFSYQHLVLRAVQAAYPGKVWDAMFDEAFHGNPFHRGGGQLVNPIICEWAADTGLFRHVYAEMYTGEELAAVMAKARAVGYDAVISLAGRGRLQVAQAAREMAPQALIIAWELRGRWWRLGSDTRAYRAAVDVTVGYRDRTYGHVIEMYADFFRAFADVPVTDWEQVATMRVPVAAATRAAEVLAGYGRTKKTPVVLVNPFAKNRKRTWPSGHTARLLACCQQETRWAQAIWLINGMPSDRAAVEEMIGKEHFPRTYFFSATEGFWELPAMIAASDLVVSVETSVMHLASLLRRPQVALMRQKTPYWRPLRREHCCVLTTPGRRDTVAAITPERVAAAMRSIK